MNNGTSDSLLKASPAQHIAQRKAEFRGPSGILKFPANLGAHATLMRFFQYSYGGNKGSVQQPLAEVLLPLPKQINDSFKINVGGDELQLLGSAAADIANSMGGGEGKMGETFNSLGKASAQGLSAGLSAAAGALSGDTAAAQEAMAKVADSSGFIAKAGLAQIAPDIANGMGVGRGTALNPFATLVFKGVDLKVHSLEWLLSPESVAEQRELKKIIRTLQRMVLPKTQNPVGDKSDFGLSAVDKGILTYPAMVNIYFQGIDQSYYFRFKTSMISQLNIDYTPNGLAINKGGKPSAIRITMTLNEAYIHTADDNSELDLIREGTYEGDLPAIASGTSTDGEGRGPNAQASTSIPFNAPNVSFDTVFSDEIIVTKTLADGSTVETVADAGTSAPVNDTSVSIGSRGTR